MTRSALLLTASLAGLAAQDLPLDAGWRVEAAAGDRVELTVVQGQLRLAYAVAVDRHRQDGHASQLVGGFRVLLERPQPIAPGQERVAFSAAGLGRQALLRPLVADASGEVFSYVPYAGDLLRQGGEGSWGDWRSCPFRASEAGGAQNGIYDASGGDGNAWPDGPLTLIGFEVRLTARPGQPERRSGTLALGRLALAGVRVVEDRPALYADALLGGAGRHRIGIQVRDAFQGAPVREQVLELDGDPADPASAGRRLVIDDGGLPRSWIRCRVERAGAPAAEWERRWERDLPPAAERAAPADGTRPPAIGHLRLDLDGDGVLAPDAPLAATVRVFPGAGIDRLAWRLLPVRHQDVLAAGEVPVPAGTDPADLRLALPDDGGRTAWRLEVRALANGREVDRQERLLGRRSDPAACARPRPGARRTRDQVKASAYVRLTYLPPKSRPLPTEAQSVAHVAEMLDRSAPITRDVTYMIDLSEFEVLPGVFDTAVLDRVMDAAADRGVGLTIRIAHGEANNPFRWHPYTRPRNWDGSVITGHPYYGAYALTDPDYRASWDRAFRHLHDRYGAHAGFQGWYVMLASGEWNLPERPWEGQVCGYAWSDREAFRAWLRDDQHLDLAALNRRWGAAYADWSAVQPPVPDLAAGATPERGLAWLDFCRFKAWLDEGWCARAAAAIRAYAPDHVVIGYSLDGGVRLDGLPHPDLVAHADYLHNGGNHTLQWEGALTGAWQRGLGWITEPHDPHAWASYGEPNGRGWTLDWSTFIMAAQAGGGGMNAHVYYWPNPGLSLAAHYGGKAALDRFQRLRPILDELHGMRLAGAPPAVAVWQDPLTLFAKHRTVFASRRQDLRRWFELLKDDAVPFEDFRTDHAADYRLLVLNPLDEVVERTLVEEVDRRVRAGATVLISGRAGERCPELDGRPFPLLRRLGIAAPAGPWRGDEAGLAALPAAASPLLASADPIPFFTRADQAAALADPAIAGRFWQWPYRFLPVNDALGRYTGAGAGAGGEVLARFPDGGAALSLHPVGQGRALVWWGTPRIDHPAMAGFMARLAGWCGAAGPLAGSPLPRLLEGEHPELGRRYALVWQDRPGEYPAALPAMPDGEWFIDELNAGERLGLWTGAELRRGDLRLRFADGASPLKVLRCSPPAQIGADWARRFRVPPR